MFTRSSLLKAILFIFISNISFAQNFLNGSFEVNTAVTDQINLGNPAFNGFMSNVNSYGTTPNLDIIRSATWGGGGAQHCTWYIAMTGSATDAFNMTLSAPLVTGQTYTISYYDRKDAGWPGFPVQIGVSTNNNSIGTIVYTAPVGATTNVWTQRTFTFVAPNNGQFISVIQNAGTTQTWVHVDNFVMNNVLSAGSLNIAASATTICQGSSAVFTVSGASTYTWNPSATLSSATASVVTATPPTTTTYSVTGNAGGCIYTGTITLNVIPPPAVTVTPVNSGICPGQSVTLTATGASSYTWTPSATLNTATGSVVIASPLAATNYTVIGGAGSCTSSAVASVTMNPGPTLSASNQTICAGSAATCTVSGASTYTWQPGNINGSSMTVSPLATTVYTVSGTNASGCVSTITMQVVVNPMPVPNANSNSPVCLNFPLNLTANAATSYTWSGPNSFSSNLQNPTIPSATTINAGVYTVTVSTLGCSSVGSVTVIVTTPTTSAANTGPYCAGSTISLSTLPATTYTWSGPGGYSSNSQNATQANSTPAMSGTYTVMVSIGTCTANATTNVVVNALPAPAASNTGPYCPTTTIQLNVGAFSTYTWTGPSFNSNQQNPTIANAAVANTGNYVVTVTDANGCINSSTTSVLVNPTPVITVNNPGTCVNQTINLTSTGGGTYSWSGPMSFASTAQNPNISNAVLGMSGPYTVLVTSAAGCTNSAVSNVTVYPLPTPNIASNSPVCAGQTLNLFGTGGANYAWSGPGYTGLTQNPTINNVTAAANGVYTLLVSSGTCTASTTFTVVINPIPVFNFSGSNVLCNGQSNGTSTVNVTVGTGPFNYAWSTIPSQTTQDASNLAAGTYSCVVTDANNCSNVASTQITQPTAFSVTINSSTLSACAGSPINVNAIGAGGTGPYTYNWVSGPATSVYLINESVDGNYLYTVNATDAFNCPATNVINLSFFPQPTVTATSATVCSGQTTNLTASGAITYVWQPGNITGATYPFSGNTPINVSVVGTANGCSNSATASVIVNPNPTANINLGNAKGCVPTCVTFSAGGSSNITSYGWILNGAGITGSVNGAYCFDEAASYTLGLTVLDINGCSSSVVPVNIEIYPQPVADFNHAPLKPIINQDPFVTFTDASYGTPIVSWNWYFMNTAQYTSIEQNPTFPYTEPGTYPVVLVVKSDRGCTDTLIRPLVVGEDFGIYVPNAFTPNADGLNDIFQPKGFGVVKYELNIFDRWGEKVFSTTTFEEGWNGTMKSKNDVKYGILEEGTYSWLINATSVFGKAHELKGHVILLK